MSERKIPTGHPIQKHWRNNKLRQHTTGLIKLAREGDTNAARELLRNFAHASKWHLKELEHAGRNTVNDPYFKELLEYIIGCIGELNNADSADAAFMLKPANRRRGRPKSEMRSDLTEKDVMLGHLMFVQMRDHAMTYDDAAAYVGEKHHVSDATVKDAYNKYMKI